MLTDAITPRLDVSCSNGQNTATGTSSSSATAWHPGWSSSPCLQRAVVAKSARALGGCCIPGKRQAPAAHWAFSFLSWRSLGKFSVCCFAEQVYLSTHPFLRNRESSSRTWTCSLAMQCCISDTTASQRFAWVVFFSSNPKPKRIAIHLSAAADDKPNILMSRSPSPSIKLLHRAILFANINSA